jgi:hypothetical protein
VAVLLKADPRAVLPLKACLLKACLLKARPLKARPLKARPQVVHPQVAHPVKAHPVKAQLRVGSQRRAVNLIWPVLTWRGRSSMPRSPSAGRWPGIHAGKGPGRGRAGGCGATPGPGPIRATRRSSALCWSG